MPHGGHKKPVAGQQLCAAQHGPSVRPEPPQWHSHGAIKVPGSWATSKIVLFDKTPVPVTNIDSSLGFAMIPPRGIKEEQKVVSALPGAHLSNACGRAVL